MKSSSSPFLRAESSCCSRLCPVRFWLSPGMETGQSLSQLCQYLTLLTTRKIVFLCFNGFSYVLICALASSPLVSLRRAWFHLISPCQVFVQVGKSPFSKLSSPSSLRLSLYDCCSIPLIMFAGFQTFLKAWKNISRSWQLFPSLWQNSSFYCQCNCGGGSACACELTYVVLFPTLLYPIISAYDHFIYFQFWSELWALPIQDIGYPLQFPADESPWPLLTSCQGRKVRVALNSLPRHVPSGTWSCCSFLS